MRELDTNNHSVFVMYYHLVLVSFYNGSTYLGEMIEDAYNEVNKNV